MKLATGAGAGAGGSLKSSRSTMGAGARLTGALTGASATTRGGRVVLLLALPEAVGGLGRPPLPSCITMPGGGGTSEWVGERETR